MHTFVGLTGVILVCIPPGMDFLAPLQARGVLKQYRDAAGVVCGSSGPVPQRGSCWQCSWLCSSKSCYSWSLFLLLLFPGMHPANKVPTGKHSWFQDLLRKA